MTRIPPPTPSQPRRHDLSRRSPWAKPEGTKTSRRHRRKLTQRRRGAEPSQRKTAKTRRTQSHRTFDSMPIGRTATARPSSPRGYAVPGRRGISARWTDHHVQTRVDRIHLHLGSRLRHARPVSVDSRSATSFPHVTLSERVRRPTPRDLHLHVTLSEPLRGASRRVPRSTDSHRSNLFRIQLRWASTPRSRNEIVGAGFTPAPASPRIPAWIPWPPGPVASHRSPLPGTSCWGGCKTLPYGFSQRQIAGGTPAPQFLPFSKKRECRLGIAKAEPLYSEHSGRGIGMAGRKLAFGTTARFHGGGGRRPQPTPPGTSVAMIREIREIRVQFAMCDVSAPLRFSLRCLCVLCALAVSSDRS
jgi:hypothetical protein